LFDQLLKLLFSETIKPIQKQETNFDIIKKITFTSCKQRFTIKEKQKALKKSFFKTLKSGLFECT
jgi:hypothetical protein